MTVTAERHAVLPGRTAFESSKDERQARDGAAKRVERAPPAAADSCVQRVTDAEEESNKKRTRRTERGSVLQWKPRVWLRLSR